MPLQTLQDMSMASPIIQSIRNQTGHKSGHFRPTISIMSLVLHQACWVETEITFQ